MPIEQSKLQDNPSLCQVRREGLSITQTWNLTFLKCAFCPEAVAHAPWHRSAQWVVSTLTWMEGDLVPRK